MLCSEGSSCRPSMFEGRRRLPEQKRLLPCAAAIGKGIVMSVIREAIGEGIFFNMVPSDSFKSRELTVNFIVPLARDTAAPDALLARRSFKRTQDVPESFSYTAQAGLRCMTAHLSGHTGKRGEAQVITFSASVLNADCIPDGRMHSVNC